MKPELFAITGSWNANGRLTFKSFSATLKFIVDMPAGEYRIFQYRAGEWEDKILICKITVVTKTSDDGY